MRINLAHVETVKSLSRFSDAPKGWKKLGSGSSRTAFLAPDGLVYKVCSDYDTYQSQNEAKVVWTWRKRNDLPEWLIIPRAHYFDGVLIMEYFEGTQPRCSSWDGCKCGQAVCWNERLREVTRLGWCDPQTANAVLTTDGRVVIIDLGCN